ncbi:MAG: hypothetical protein M3P40_08565, partial [Actinomycetota bacterium]|nr:hypothetical protein [Actinomycetota bacterium]
GDDNAVVATKPARLAAPAAPDDNRTTFLSATFEVAEDGMLEAMPMPEQGSHLTGALARADGFVIAPHRSGPLPAGSLIRAIPLA